MNNLDIRCCVFGMDARRETSGCVIHNKRLATRACAQNSPSVCPSYSLTSPKRIERAENGGMAKAFGHAAGVERINCLGLEDVELCHVAFPLLTKSAGYSSAFTIFLIEIKRAWIEGIPI